MIGPLKWYTKVYFKSFDGSVNGSPPTAGGGANGDYADSIQSDTYVTQEEYILRNCKKYSCSKRQTWSCNDPGPRLSNKRRTYVS